MVLTTKLPANPPTPSPQTTAAPTAQPATPPASSTQTPAPPAAQPAKQPAKPAPLIRIRIANVDYHFLHKREVWIIGTVKNIGNEATTPIISATAYNKHNIELGREYAVYPEFEPAV